MTRMDILMPQFEILTRLADGHLWVTTEELCDILRLEARDLYDAQAQLTTRFDWRNFHVRQAKYAGNGQHFWEVINRGKAAAAEAAAPAPTAPPDALAEPPELVLQRYCFMPSDFRRQLLDHVMAHQDRFYPAVTHSAPAGYRHCLAFDDLGPFDQILQDRLAGVFAPVAHALGIPTFQVVAFERQIIAYPDGCYFRPHTDASDAAPARRISFVYYFHRTPRAYSGGELLLLGDRADSDSPFPVLTEVQPQDNSIVFFDSRRRHEVRPVQVPSGEFADSRFAITGWIHGPGARV